MRIILFYSITKLNLYLAFNYDFTHLSHHEMEDLNPVSGLETESMDLNNATLAQ